MNQTSLRLKLIQDLGLALLALSLILIPHGAYAQSAKRMNTKPKTVKAVKAVKANKKVVRLTFDGMNGKNKKSKNPRRIPASLIEERKHGNIVQVQDYIHDVEALDAKKSIIPRNKKPVANDAEISRDDIVIAQ